MQALTQQAPGTTISLSVIPVVFHFVFFNSNNGDYTLHIGVLLTSKYGHMQYLVFFHCVFLWVQMAALPRGSNRRRGTDI